MGIGPIGWECLRSGNRRRDHQWIRKRRFDLSDPHTLVEQLDGKPQWHRIRKHHERQLYQLGNRQRIMDSGTNQLKPVASRKGISC